MSNMEIYEEMKDSRQWDSRYFELKREQDKIKKYEKSINKNRK